MPRAATSVATSTLNSPPFEPVHGPLALRLRPVRMDRLSLDAVAVKPPCDTVGTVFCAGKYEHRSDVLFFKDMREEIGLNRLGNLIKFLLTVFTGERAPRSLSGAVSAERFGEPADLW